MSDEPWNPEFHTCERCCEAGKTVELAHLVDLVPAYLCVPCLRSFSSAYTSSPMYEENRLALEEALYIRNACYGGNPNFNCETNKPRFLKVIARQNQIEKALNKAIVAWLSSGEFPEEIVRPYYKSAGVKDA